MLSLRRSFILLIATVALLVPAGTASAQGSTAQRFADAVERGKSAMNAKVPEVQAAYDAIEWPRCQRVIARTPPPKRETDRFSSYFAAVLFQPLFGPAQPVLQQIVADLYAIPTNDAILRSGRSAWRQVVEVLGKYPQTDQPCVQLEAWARSGWKASGRPDFDFAAFDRLIEESDDPSLERKFERAARRLRQLGVSKGDAKRFTGETIFEAIEQDVELP
jgi:hypothetical protein